MRFDVGPENWITVRDSLGTIMAEFRGMPQDVVEARQWNKLVAIGAVARESNHMRLDRADEELDVNHADAVYEYIASYRRHHGYMPTIREIMQDVGLSSTSIVNYWLGRLERAGRIRRTSRTARSIVLVESPMEVAP